MKPYNRSLLLSVSALLLVVLMLVGTALPVCAAEEDKNLTAFAYDATNASITATFDDGSSKTYYRYDGSTESPLQCHPYSGFEYTATMVIDGNVYRIATPEKAGEVLFLYRVNENRHVTHSLLFLTEEGKEATETLATESSNNVTMLVGKGLLPAAATVHPGNAVRDGIHTLLEDKSAERVTFSTEELRYAPVYAVMNTGDDRWIGRVTGHIFDLHGAYYYISVESLPAGYLQADGWIGDVPGGSLTLIRIGEDSPLHSRLEDILPLNTRHYSFSAESYTWDDPFYSGGFGDADAEALALLFIAVILFGILLPALPIAAGLVLPNLRALGRKKRWYLLAILGGAWLLCGVVLLVMTVVFM